MYRSAPEKHTSDVRFKQAAIMSIALLVLLTLLLVANGMSVRAQDDRVLNVDTGLWYPTIQSAISAPSTVDGHTLNVTASTYDENIVITKSLTIIGAGPGTTFVDGGGRSQRVIIVPDNEARVSISNMAVQNGAGLYNQGHFTLVNSIIRDHRMSTPFPPDFGVAIHNSGVLTVTNSQIVDNIEPSSSNTGGSIYNTGMVTVISTTIGNNESAGIRNQTGGSVDLVNSTVSHNDGEHVGGIYNNGTLTVTNSLIEGNSTALVGGTADAGGILNHDTLTVLSSTISGNETCNKGGGIHNSGTLVMNGSIISDNYHVCYPSSEGGGIYNTGALTITNSTLSGNTSDTGGGIFVGSGTVRLNNVTVAYNTSANVGGISQTGGVVEVQHTIIAQNVGPSPDCSGIITSLGYNLLGDNTGCTFTPMSGDIVGTGSSPVDPLLGPLQDNGGRTTTHALLPGSLAIDAGHNATCPAVDQRGFARPMDGNDDGIATCDIGAYELQPPNLIVTKQANLDLVQAGMQLTYTICITNTGYVDLHAVITDELPTHVIPGGILTWTPTISTPGGVWTEQFPVTVEVGYTGPLTNVVEVTTVEGATGTYTQVSTVTPLSIYLPLTLRSYTAP